jgi:hypothetical protein
MSADDGNDTLTHGFWLVAFLDLLGQQEAFLKTDYIPEHDDPATRREFVEQVQASVGVIRLMRRLLASFRNAVESVKGDVDEAPALHGFPADAIDRYRALRACRVREYRLSDGVMLACPLKPEVDHATPVLAVHEILATCAALMLVQLAAGRPIRGGLDVGTGMEVDGELFGASLVKAYRLESKEAQHPRLVVGPGLVNYLTTCTQAPGEELEARFERSMAAACLGLLVADEDGHMIVDYAGPKARGLLLGSLDPGDVGIVPAARAFAHRSRDDFRRLGDNKLFDRYSKLVRYLDARARLWGDSTEHGRSANL